MSGDEKGVLFDHESPMRVVELRAENFKRLRAVAIRPDGSALVTISGRNSQGNSSVLDAIAAALGGAKAEPEMPVRHGARRAVVKVGPLSGKGGDPAEWPEHLRVREWPMRQTHEQRSGA